MRTTELADRLGCALPVAQAPLGGGPGTPELTAAAVEAGAFGFLGAGYLDPADVQDAVRRTRALTREPFGVNVFLAPQPGAPESPEARRRLASARARLADVAGALGLEAEIPERPRGLPDPHEQLEVLLAEHVPVLSFTFGCPTPEVVRRLRDRGVTVLVTVGTVQEARAAESAGADALVAQGAEAGGHRGGWTGVPPPGLAVLVPAVVDAVAVPVVASGGVMDGRGVVAALALGADLVALGTAFLRCPEAGTDDAYRAALAASDGRTVVTSAFSGRPARGLPNAYLAAMEGAADLAEFPVLNYLTRPLRAASAAAGRADAMSLWAGEGVTAGRELPAGKLVEQLVREADAALERLAGR